MTATSARLGRDVELDLIAVVAVRAGVVAHDARLRPDGEAAGEDIEVLDARLQMHHPLARLVVGCVQLLGPGDPGDAHPHAAVERLHEERVADPLGDLVEVEVRL